MKDAQELLALDSPVGSDGHHHEVNGGEGGGNSSSKINGTGGGLTSPGSGSTSQQQGYTTLGSSFNRLRTRSTPAAPPRSLTGSPSSFFPFLRGSAAASGAGGLAVADSPPLESVVGGVGSLPGSPQGKLPASGSGGSRFTRWLSSNPNSNPTQPSSSTTATTGATNGNGRLDVDSDSSDSEDDANYTGGSITGGPGSVGQDHDDDGSSKDGDGDRSSGSDEGLGVGGGGRGIGALIFPPGGDGGGDSSGSELGEVGPGGERIPSGAAAALATEV